MARKKNETTLLTPNQAAEKTLVSSRHIRNLCRHNKVKNKRLQLPGKNRFTYLVDINSLKSYLKETPTSGFPRGEKRTGPGGPKA